MEQYSQYFTTLYDQQEPTGQLGRGTHYSVLRATSWHAPYSCISPRAYHFDFSIIWDEDHDRRVIGCVEEIYLHGLLSKFSMFGERKGMLTAILSENCSTGPGDNELKDNIQWIAGNAADGDHFSSDIVRLNDSNNGIISDTDEKVGLYLNNINMLWQLGGKPIPSAGDDGETIPFPIKFS